MNKDEGVYRRAAKMTSIFKNSTLASTHYVALVLVKQALYYLKGKNPINILSRTKRKKHSHILAYQSPLPVANTSPAGLRSIDTTEFLGPCNMHGTVAVRASQNCNPTIFRARDDSGTVVGDGDGSDVVL